MKFIFLSIVLFGNIFSVFAKETMYQFEIRPDKENIRLGDSFAIRFHIKNVSSAERRLNAYSFIHKPGLMYFFYERENNIAALDFCVSLTVLYEPPDNPFIVLEPGDEYEFSSVIAYEYMEKEDIRTLKLYKGNALEIGPVFIPVLAEIDSVFIVAEFKDADNNLLKSNRISLRLDNDFSVGMVGERGNASADRR
ncbi:MAG: hypothetical protein LBU00_08290 [Treponema sp.]|jgi:hypothetical protein|nr:hypothetical protein [Treponema sp.]